MTAVMVLMAISILSPLQPVYAQSSIIRAGCPHFDSSNFSHPTEIANPYLPMKPGTVFVYSGLLDGQPQAGIVRITDETRTIGGVRAIVVNDTVTVNGVKEETTLDYFAQDNSGNVWYLGEDVLLIKNGQVTGHNGSWIAGVNGAQPGFIMEANPKVGDYYCNENAVDVAQDQAQVINTSSSVCTPYVCADRQVLLINDTSPLKPGNVEHKWYVMGVGNVMARDVVGGQDEVQLDAILQTSVQPPAPPVYQASTAVLGILFVATLAMALIKRRRQ